MRRSSGLRLSLAATVVSLAAAACTDTTQLPRADETPAANATGATTPGPGFEPDSIPGRQAGGEQHVQPVVVVAHATREPIDISLRMTRRLMAGKVRSWRALGLPRGPVRMLAAPGLGAAEMLEVASAERAVRQVTRDRNTVAVVPAAAVGPQVRVAKVGGVHPLREAADYPLKIEAGECPPEAVTVTVVGDIMLGRGVQAAARGTGDPVHQLRPMQERLAAADITVGNLENTVSRAGAPTQGGDSFAAAPATARGLVEAGFDVLSLANNHLGDFGDRALVQTVRRLRRAGLETFGAGADLSEAMEPVVLERGEVSFAFLGFNAIGETPAAGPHQPGAVSVSMPPRTGPLNRRELDRFLDVVAEYDVRADVVVAMPHWGTQYTNVPEPVQSRVARRLVDSGADLVVGGHPHWVQGTELLQDTMVVHSLGNFVFDMDFMAETQKGLMLELTFWGTELKGAEFVPYQMDRDFAPRVESWRNGLDTLELMWETSGPEFRRFSG